MNYRFVPYGDNFPFSCSAYLYDCFRGVGYYISDNKKVYCYKKLGKKVYKNLMSSIRISIKIVSNKMLSNIKLYQINNNNKSQLFYKFSFIENNKNWYFIIGEYYSNKQTNFEFRVF